MLRVLQHPLINRKNILCELGLLLLYEWTKILISTPNPKHLPTAKFVEHHFVKVTVVRPLVAAARRRTCLMGGGQDE
jgi:hypothetical protein